MFISVRKNCLNYDLFDLDDFCDLNYSLNYDLFDLDDFCDFNHRDSKITVGTMIFLI